MAGPSLETIRKLFAASGNQCVFPGCEKRLVEEGDAVRSRLCHIRQGQPDSPRYEWALTDPEANEPGNLLLICSEHDAEIDEDPETYTVAGLRGIKAAHEAAHAGGPELSDAVARIYIAKLELATYEARARRRYWLWHFIRTRGGVLAVGLWVMLCVIGPKVAVSKQAILLPLCVLLAGLVGHLGAGRITRTWERFWSWRPQRKRALRGAAAVGLTALVLLWWWAGYRPEPEPAAVRHYRRGVAHIEGRRYEQALRELTRAIELHPGYVEAYLARSHVYFTMGDNDRAIADLSEVIRLAPDLAAGYTSRAGAYLNRGEPDRAIADCCQAIRLDPNDAMAWSNRGGAYGRKGQHDRAIADCTQAIRLDATLALAYRNRGTAYCDLGRWEEAFADHTKAVELDATDASAFYGRGVVCARTGRHDAAIEDYTRAVQLDPQLEEAWCNRGSARLQKGDYAGALADYNAALRLDPRDNIALTARFLAAAGGRLRKRSDLRRDLAALSAPRPREPLPSPDDGNVPPAPRPSARRVASRALVLAAVVLRAALERVEARADAKAFRSQILHWLDGLGLAAEIENAERDFLELPVGWAKEQAAINASWRNEGLGVLAWALGRCELPPYDQGIDLLSATDGVGFLDTDAAKRLLEAGALRTPAEIDAFASHITIVRWRLVEYRLGGRTMSFATGLKLHPAYRQSWLNGLRLVGGDLAIGDRAIGNAPDDAVQTCRSIALERQIAAYWLQGDARTYSRVMPATVLSALGSWKNAPRRPNTTLPSRPK